jgi:hypothetical protein
MDSAEVIVVDLPAVGPCQRFSRRPLPNKKLPASSVQIAALVARLGNGALCLVALAVFAFR